MLQNSTMSYSNQLGNQGTVIVQHNSVRLHDNQFSYPNNQFAHPDNQFSYPGNHSAYPDDQFDTTSSSKADLPENTQQNDCSDELVLL